MFKSDVNLININVKQINGTKFINIVIKYRFQYLGQNKIVNLQSFRKANTK